MKKVGICNYKDCVEKTTICLCLGGVFADMGLAVLLIDMHQQGSMRSSFYSKIHGLSPVVTDVLRYNQAPTRTGVSASKYQDIDILPANLSHSDPENEQAEAFRRLGTEVFDG